MRSGSPDGVSLVSEVEYFKFSDGTVETLSLLSPKVNNPDGTHTVTTYDTGNAYPWSSMVSTYDTANRLATQTFNEDVGDSWTNAYDAGDAFNWAWSTSHRDSSGNLISQVTTNDNGTTYTLAAHDTAGIYDWSDFTVAFDANWYVTSQSGHRHDGVLPLPTSVLPWTRCRGSFTPSTRLVILFCPRPV